MANNNFPRKFIFPRRIGVPCRYTDVVVLLEEYHIEHTIPALQILEKLLGNISSVKELESGQKVYLLVGKDIPQEGIAID
jgi:hypothetical protein